MLKRLSIFLLKIFVPISLFAINVAGKTYYVDVNSTGGKSSDSNSGTISAPWKTVYKGFTSAKPGDTVYFRKGTYRVKRQISSFTKGATKDSRIRFKSYSGERAIISAMQLRDDSSNWRHEGGQIYSTSITPQTKLSTSAVSRIPNVSQQGIPLKLMTSYNENGDPGDLAGPGQWARSVKTWKIYVWAKGGGNPGNYRTEICEFPEGGRDIVHTSANAGDDKNEADYLTFENLTFEGAYYPINVETDHVEIRGCTIRNCYGDAIKVGGRTKPKDPMNPDSPDDPNYYNSTHGLVENCDIYHFGESGIDITGGDYWTLRGNKFHDSIPNRGYLISSSNPLGTKGNGIMMKNNDIGNIVENNDLYNLITKDMGLITIGGDTQVYGGAVDCIVRNNRFYDSSGPYAVMFQGAHNCQFINNVIENCTFDKHTIRIRSTADKEVFQNKNCKIADNHFFGNKVNNNGYADQIYIYRDSFDTFEIDGDALDPTKTYFYNGKRRSLANFQSYGYERNSTVSKGSLLSVATNNPPNGSFTMSSTSGITPLTVSFDATKSTDSDGSIVSYKWNFGDGSAGSGGKVSHQYIKIGVFTATLTVIDDKGAKDTASKNITVNPESSAATTTEGFPVLLIGKSTVGASTTVKVSVNKPAGATKAKIQLLEVFDGDNANEGELYINDSSTPITLFGSKAAKSADATWVPMIEFDSNVNDWVDGENTLRFKHTATHGFRVKDIKVVFSGITSEPSEGFPVLLIGKSTIGASTTVKVPVNKPTGATMAKIQLLEVFDADNANEGELYINGSSTPITLFGSKAAKSADATWVPMIEFETNVNDWVDGENTLRFKHTATHGFRVKDIKVVFSGTTSEPSEGFPVLLIGKSTIGASTTVKVPVNKPTGATKAKIQLLEVFDADNANEGELYINGSSTPIILFGSKAAKSADATWVPMIEFETNVNDWVDGDNTLRFKHTISHGFRVKDVRVVFSTTTSKQVTKSVQTLLSESELNQRMSTSVQNNFEEGESRTIYEDAEDGTTAGWYQYNDGMVEIISGGADGSERAIAITGDLENDVFRLAREDGSDWNNTTDFFAEFSVAMDQPGSGAIYLQIDTDDGIKYLVYADNMTSENDSPDLIHINLGDLPDGQWHTVFRSLKEDLATAIPDTQLRSVKSLFVYGSANLDNVTLLNSAGGKNN